MTHSATYSPEDNKLRLYPSCRLDEETYRRVKAAGFIWAPRQELFVAPAWTPDREDLLLELAGEIGDEDTSLVERAEERADRFQDYSAARAEDAEHARKAVDAIADNIPLGQPILVGHHSERHARRDAEKIENGMGRAIRMWDTAQYWKARAAGAIRAAKYKERPDVRARRIKGLESEIRVMRARYTPDPKQPPIMQERWNADRSGTEGVKVPHVWCSPGGRGGHWVAQEDLPKLEAYYSRWIAHCERRLVYERAMLAEAGGLITARHQNIEVGGRVLVGREWYVVMRVNRKDGQITSVRTNARYCSLTGIEEVSDYRPPDPEEAAKVQAATKLPPLTNFPSEGCHTMTEAEWKAKHRDYRMTSTAKATDKHGAYRYRVVVRGGNLIPVFLTDAKRVDPPAPRQVPAVEFQREVEYPLPAPRPVAETEPQAAAFKAMRDKLRAGVQVISAPQLFPTPPALAARMVELAEIAPEHRVLEPSAGTGNILRAIGNAPDKVAVEINRGLTEILARAGVSGLRIHEGDFLACKPGEPKDWLLDDDLGKFDRILMNPPFENATDIKHILHALNFLKPGGRLVAICANGPRQNEKLQPIADTWEELPADAFEKEGTRVSTVLLSIREADLCATCRGRRVVEMIGYRDPQPCEDCA